MAKYYDYEYKGIKLDIYRILKIYGITEPAQQHAIKKLFRAGKSIKNLEQDIDEVIESLNRWKEMIKEDSTTKANGEGIADIKKIVTDKKKELSDQLNELPKNDKNAETIRKKQMLTHSILVLRTILDKI